MKNSLAALALILAVQAYSQQNFYEVNSGNGNGLRLWGATNDYKIHMGNTAEYQYGPVTEYSMKFNMNTSNAGRGWTWGSHGATPVAALQVGTGNFQVRGTFTYGGDVMQSIKTLYTQFQFATHDWSASHAIFFNAYKNITVNGSLGALGNANYANDAGMHANGAGSIIYYGNGGSMGFYLSPPSTGMGNAVNWGQPVLWLQRGGNVGIGQSAPSHKLEVRGAIRATEVKVDAQWWDSVFEPDYELTPLWELEAFVKENKHLPDMPTEADVNENGAALGEVVSLLLKKVEELTLYTIEQQKEIEALKAQLSKPE